jgi:hypothetical protein
MFSTRLKTGLLVAAHIAAGLLLSYASSQMPGKNNNWVFGAFLVVIFADSGLAGIWGGLGTTKPQYRFPITLGISAYLGGLIIWLSHGHGTKLVAMVATFLLVALPTWLILLPLSILRHSRRHLNVVQCHGDFARDEGMQFTIRQLFLATTVVAIMLGLGRGIQGLDDRSVLGMFIGLAIVCPWIVIVELAILWGSLGIGRPWPRLLVVLPTAFVVGAIPMFSLKSGFIVIVIWSCIIGFQAVITAGSLLVIRSCGYRLVRGAAIEPTASPFEESCG